MQSPRHALAALCATASLLLAPLPALAAPLLVMQITDGMNTLTIFDGAIADADPTAGSVAFNASNVFGNWNTVAATATGLQSPLDLEVQARFDTTLDRFDTGDPRTLSFIISMTAFDAGALPSALTFFTTTSGAVSGGTTGGWNAYVDDADTLLGTATAAGGSPSVGATSGSTTLLLDGSYSATLRASFSVAGAAGPAVSGEQVVRMALPSHTVPTPGTAALVMGGLLLAARRPRR